MCQGMKLCECGGDLLRHGVARYKSAPAIVGVRYKCRECGRTFTQRMGSDEHKEKLRFNSAGRPHYQDWRHAV